MEETERKQHLGILKDFRRVVHILTPAGRRQLVQLSVAVFVSAVVQVVGVVSILPFMAIVANPDLIIKQHWVRHLCQAIGVHDTNTILVAAGVVVIAILALGNATSALTAWLNFRFAARQGHELSVRLLRAYLAKPYAWFLSHNTATLSKHILVEVKSIVTDFLQPITLFASKAFLAVLILVVLLTVDPLIALAAAVLLGGAYGVIYGLVHRRLQRMGEEKLEANAHRFKMSKEVLFGVKDAKVFQCEDYFVGEFERVSQLAADLSVHHSLIGQMPRYAIETLTYGGTVGIVIYLLTTSGDVRQFLPLLSLYAVAGYRLVPSLQQAFAALTQIQFSRAIINEVHDVLHYLAESRAEQKAGGGRMQLRDSIVLRNVTFAYPESTEPVLRDFSLTIPCRSSIGVVGTTGAGKSTLIDLLLGLLHPDDGAIEVDGVALTPDNVRDWQRSIGYVPQQLYISDASVIDNVAFGVASGLVNVERVKQAARAAHLHDFILRELPLGYNTTVRESGVRLSGGQRQRLGIARALYHDPDVLVLDEATSSLDGATEEAVMDAIRELGGSKTVIMVAHRLSTVKSCDTIYLIGSGRIEAMGTYDELMETSAHFRAMAREGGPEGNHRG